MNTEAKKKSESHSSADGGRVKKARFNTILQRISTPQIILNSCQQLYHNSFQETKLTRQKVLNGSNQWFAVSRGHKISFSLEEKSTVAVKLESTATVQLQTPTVVNVRVLPPSGREPQPWLLQSEEDGGSSHHRQSQRCMGCTHTR